MLETRGSNGIYDGNPRLEWYICWKPGAQMVYIMETRGSNGIYDGNPGLEWYI